MVEILDLQRPILAGICSQFMESFGGTINISLSLEWHQFFHFSYWSAVIDLADFKVELHCTDPKSESTINLEYNSKLIGTSGHPFLSGKIEFDIHNPKSFDQINECLIALANFIINAELKTLLENRCRTD